MSKIHSYQDLTVWQKSIDLVVEVYNLTSKFPKSEQYGLSLQIRRAAISIASNIAEGYKRRHLGEYVQFLSIANGSAGELETQIIIAQKIEETKKLNFTKVKSLLEEIEKMLYVLIFKLSQK